MVQILIRPICPSYLAAIPVAEFIPAANNSAKYSRKRKLQVKLATAVWANREQIKAFYLKARTRTMESGNRHVVDHIVPLQHPLVCGLHVPANMRIIASRANAVKNNRFDPAGDDL